MKQKAPPSERVVIRISLDRKDVQGWIESRRGGCLGRGPATRVLLQNAIRSAWAYNHFRVQGEKEQKAIHDADTFFRGLHDLQSEAQEAAAAVNGSIATVRRAAEEAVRRCRRWYDVEEIRKAAAAASPNRPKLLEYRKR